MRVPWLVIVAIGLGTFLIRFSFLFLFGHIGDVPDRLERALRFVPAAVLSALVVPAILAPEGAVAVLGNLRLLAAIVAVAVALRTESILWTILSGLTALAALQTII